MRLRPHGWKRLAAASIAVACGSGIIGVGDRASAVQEQVPLAFEGTVAGASDLHPDDLLISIEPDPGWLSAHTDGNPGGSIYESTVPARSIMTDGAHFEVRLDPRDLPPQDITSYGLVTLTVSAQNASGEDGYGTDVLSIRAVLLPDGSYGWVDPLAPSDLVDAGSPDVPAAALRAYRTGVGNRGLFRPSDMWAKSVQSRVVVDVKRFRGHGSLTPAINAAHSPHDSGTRRDNSGDDGDGTEQAELIADPVYDSSKCQPGPGGNGAGVVPGATRKAMTTIGTSFPVAKDRAKMLFNDTSSSSAIFKAEMGIGVQDGTGPVVQSSHLKGMDRAWGFDWIYRDYNRAFQVEQVYQHFTDWGDRCPGDPNGPYEQSWEPMRYTGGQTVLTDIATPFYRNCARQGEEGTWKKFLASSDAYDNNTGVRIADWIGINLESIRAYNQESQLWYEINQTPHWMCGNNRDPAHAQKVMDSEYDLSS